MPDLTELRDELARVCGWKLVTHHGVTAWIESKYESLLASDTRLDDGSSMCPHCFRRGEPEVTHPFPPNDLNALAAVWPEGWNYRMEMLNGWWYGAAQPDNGNVETGWGPYTERCDTEHEARLRLTLAVLKEKAHA